MRPRHKAAEYDGEQHLEVAAVHAASMRPRHKAAEYHTDAEKGHPGTLASMRPRHKAAEYGGGVGKCADRGRRASMRPRHKAAEYLKLRALIEQAFKPLQ